MPNSRGGVSRLLRWPLASSSRRGSVALTAIVLAAVLAASLAAGYKIAKPLLADGAADLSRGHTVVHANGISGSSDAEVARKLATGKERLEAVRLPNGRLAIVNHDTGRVDFIDPAAYEPDGAPEVRPESAGQVDVLTGSSRGFLVDRKRGTVEEIRPEGGAAGPVEVPGGVAQAVPVGDSVWVVTNDARVVEVAGRQVARTVSLPSGRPQLTVADGHAVAVVAAQAAYTIDGAVPFKIGDTGLSGGSDVLVGSWQGAGRHVLVVSQHDSRLIALDLRAGARTVVDLKAGSGARLGDPVEFEGRVYVPDFTGPHLVRVHLVTRELARLKVPGQPGERFELKVSGGRLWANSQYERRALVVDATGSDKTVDKGEDKDVRDSEAPHDPPPDKPAEPASGPLPTPNPGGGNRPPPHQPPDGPAAPPTAPGPPLNVLAQPGDAQALVSWGPANANRSPVTRYVITWTVLSGTGGPPGELFVSGRQLTATVPNLVNGVTYRMTVHAENAVGAGPGADSPPVTPSASIPGTPSNVRAVAGPDGTVRASWAAAAGQGHQILRYDVTANGDDGTSSQIAQTAGTSTSVTMRAGEGLTLGVRYTFSVTAVSDRTATGAPSAPSNPVTPYQPAQVPPNLTATGGDGFVDLRWDRPNLNGGEIVHYVVARVGGSPLTVTATSIRLGGLTNWATSQFQVHAVTRERGSAAGPTVAGADASRDGTPRPPNQPARPGCSEGVAIKMTLASGSQNSGVRPPTMYVRACSEDAGGGTRRGVMYFTSDVSVSGTADWRVELHKCGDGLGLTTNPDHTAPNPYQRETLNGQVNLRKQTWNAPVNQPTFGMARIQAMRVDANGQTWIGEDTGTGWKPGC